MNVREKQMSDKKIEIKELINIKFTEDMQHLYQKRFSEKSQLYRDKLQQVETHGKMMAEKKKLAKDEIHNIKNQLTLLNAEYLKETDSKRLKEIEEQKKEYRLRFEDLDDLVHTNINSIISNKYLQDLNLPEEEAQKEYLEYSTALSSCIEYYRELKTFFDNNIMLLSNMKNAHLYHQNISLLESIKRNEFEQDSGWVTTGRFTLPGKETIKYTGADGDE